MSTHPGRSENDPERPERIKHLVRKFRDDTLTLREAKELLGYIEVDLRKAEREGDAKGARVIRRYKNGVESYVALREGSASGARIRS